MWSIGILKQSELKKERKRERENEQTDILIVIISYGEHKERDACLWCLFRKNVLHSELLSYWDVSQATA